jgi:hypothetical protein
MLYNASIRYEENKIHCFWCAKLGIVCEKEKSGEVSCTLTYTNTHMAFHKLYYRCHGITAGRLR